MALIRFVAVALVALGCTAPRTELLLVTDTDLDTPDEIDAFEVEVTPPGGDRREAVAHLGPGELPPPRVLGIAHDGTRLGPYTLRIRGTLRGATIVERRVEVDLQRRRTLVLRVDLTRDCIARDCQERETCAAGRCRDVRVDPNELELYGAPLADTDAGACGSEICAEGAGD